MATESIFHDVVMKDEKTVENFIEALESSRLDHDRDRSRSALRYVTDPDEIRNILMKRRAKIE